MWLQLFEVGAEIWFTALHLPSSPTLVQLSNPKLKKHPHPESDG